MKKQGIEFQEFGFRSPIIDNSIVFTCVSDIKDIVMVPNYAQLRR